MSKIYKLQYRLPDGRVKLHLVDTHLLTHNSRSVVAKLEKLGMTNIKWKMDTEFTSGLAISDLYAQAAREVGK